MEKLDRARLFFLVVEGAGHAQDARHLKDLIIDVEVLGAAHRLEALGHGFPVTPGDSFFQWPVDMDATARVY